MKFTPGKQIARGRGASRFAQRQTVHPQRLALVVELCAERRLLLIPFWLAVLFAALGYVITIIPGADCDYFLVVAGLSTTGLFIPRTTYRVGAVLLLIVALISAYSGYRTGVEYRQQSSTRQAGS